MRKRDLYYWLSILNTYCPDFTFCVHSGEPHTTTDYQLIITTYSVAVKSAYLLSSNWNSLIFDNPPNIKEFDHKGLSTLKQIRSHHRIVISHPRAISEGKSESLLGTLLFPDCTVSIRQLTAFTLSRANSTIPEADRPRQIEFKTEKCILSSRQKLIYDDLLNASKDDLDSQDIDRVMSAVKKLLRVCNHADFRESVNQQLQVNIEPVQFAKYPKLIQNATVDLQTEWFKQAIRSITDGLSWVVEQQNVVCEEKYLDSIQKTQNLLIAMPNFCQNQNKHIKTEPDTTPKILKIQASVEVSNETGSDNGSNMSSQPTEGDSKLADSTRRSNGNKFFLQESVYSGTVYSNTVRMLTLKAFSVDILFYICFSSLKI